jgi:hypothetical protein
VQPTAIYDVSLALLDGSNDAALSDNVVQTSASGLADFTITASSVSGLFGVRASSGALNSILPVSVSDEGFATLNLTGSYTGIRKATEWVATVHSGASCSTFGLAIPNDGVLAARGTSATPSMSISSVPVGPVQTVVLRGDHSVWGCADVPALFSGETLDIQVPLFDIPATFDAVPIPALFEVSTNADSWASTLTSVTTFLLGSFEQSATSDVDLLLDAMRSATTDVPSASDFEQRRLSGDWYTALTNLWSNSDGSADQCIRNILNKWLSTGASLVTQGLTLDTTLSLVSASTPQAQQQLNLKLIGGFSVGDYAPTADFSLTAAFGANDELAASATIIFNDALFLRLLTLASARLQFPDAVDIPGALASLLQCDALGTILDSKAPNSAYCGASCLSQLCASALAQLWETTAAAASQRGPSTLTLSFSGALQLDANAVVYGYKGSWVGLITSPSGNVSTGGSIR